MRVLAAPLGELAQAGSVRALDRCPSFLPSLILSPPKSSWRMNCHWLLLSVWVGGSSAACLFGTRESRWRGQGGQTLLEGAVRPGSAVVLPFLTCGVGGTQTLEYLYSCSCAIREAAAPGRPAPPPLGYTHVAQTIFQIKNLLTTRVGSCIPLQVSLVLPRSTSVSLRLPPGPISEGEQRACCPSTVLSGFWN